MNSDYEHSNTQVDYISKEMTYQKYKDKNFTKSQFQTKKTSCLTNLATISTVPSRIIFHNTCSVCGSFITYLGSLDLSKAFGEYCWAQACEQMEWAQAAADAFSDSVSAEVARKYRLWQVLCHLNMHTVPQIFPTTSLGTQSKSEIGSNLTSFPKVDQHHPAQRFLSC